MAGATTPAVTTTTSEPNIDRPMLQQHTLDQLRGLRLDGMIAALTDMPPQHAAEALPVDHRLALLVPRHRDCPDGQRLARLLTPAKVQGSSPRLA